MKNTDVVVVCAGVKSILDIGKTLEYLETSGIPVIGYGTSEFPAFYSRESGYTTEYSMDTPEDIARMIRLKYQLGLKGGVLVACPIPEEDEIPLDKIESIIQLALLDRVQQLTGGKSLEANIRLVLNNARIGAQIAASR
jgi:pseudouridine-5'-phosphate glycosidase